MLKFLRIFKKNDQENKDSKFSNQQLTINKHENITNGGNPLCFQNEGFIEDNENSKLDSHNLIIKPYETYLGEGVEKKYDDFGNPCYERKFDDVRLEICKEYIKIYPNKLETIPDKNQLECKITLYDLSKQDKVTKKELFGVFNKKSEILAFDGGFKVYCSSLANIEQWTKVEMFLERKNKLLEDNIYKFDINIGLNNISN